MPVIERAKFARRTRHEVSFGDKIKDEDLEQERYKVSSRPIADHPEAVSAGVLRHHLPRRTERFEPDFPATFLLIATLSRCIDVSPSFARTNENKYRVNNFVFEISLK